MIALLVLTGQNQDFDSICIDVYKKLAMGFKKEHKKIMKMYIIDQSKNSIPLKKFDQNEMILFDKGKLLSKWNFEIFDKSDLEAGLRFLVKGRFGITLKEFEIDREKEIGKKENEDLNIDL